MYIIMHTCRAPPLSHTAAHLSLCFSAVVVACFLISLIKTEDSLCYTHG
jgi:hypothetical protein